MSEPAVSVIVPVLNGAATIERCLAALAAQDLDREYEVIVVDNGSSDGSADIAERAAGPVTVIRREPPGPGEWRGPGSSRNVGAERARGAVLAFTDADCFPTPGWLREGLAALAGADVVQGRVEADPGPRRGPFDRTLWVLGEAGLYETANLFVRRDVFERACGFEDWLHWRAELPVGEDLWLVWRARRAGARTRFADAALVHHAVFARGPGEYLADRRRLFFVPAYVRKVPELRRTLCRRRLFLSRRTARFDLALVSLGAAVAVAAPASLPLALVPLAGTMPYVATAAGRARPYGRRAPWVLAVDLAADVASLAALAAGSVRWRRVVL